MSAYANFVEDFPRRCGDVLKLASKQAKLGGREVTLLLMTASAGFVIPYERLKPDGTVPHPSGDNNNYLEAADKLKGLLAQPFLSSEVWGEPVSTWQSGKLKSVSGDPDSLEGKPLQNEKTVGDVLKVVRNALAHGNIFITNKDPIEAVIFIQTNYKGYDFVSVGPADFEIFLKKWFDFLAHLKISQIDACDVLKYAA